MNFKDLSEKELQDSCLFKANNQKPCSICEKSTEFIDYITEQRICSEECMDKQNDWLNDTCK